MLKPKCHPYWIIDGEKVINNNQVSVGHSARGYLLPCCWLDSNENYYGILDEDLKLKNHKSIKTILISPQWVKFHNTLMGDIENAPAVCKVKCNEC